MEVSVPPPAAPTLTVPGTSDNGNYTVSWTAVPAANSYQLYEKAGSGSWGQIQANSSISKSISGKANGTYSYRVRACNNTRGCGSYPATDSITVQGSPPSSQIPRIVRTDLTPRHKKFDITWRAKNGNA